MIRRELFMPMRLQFFADADTGSTGSGMSMSALDSFLDGAGTQTDPDDAGAQQTDGQAQQQAQAQTQTEAQTAQQQQQTPPAQQDQGKAGHAFAELRTQNNQLLGMLTKVAQAAGIEFKDNRELIAKLNDDALGKLAQKQNVPVELLKRMEELEQDSLAYKAEQTKQQAFLGFQKVKDAYGLTDAELTGFAAELDAAKKNPFVTPMDIMAEYRLLHFNDIVAKETQKAVAEALKKSNAADKHSSTPTQFNGKPDSGNDQKISTVSGLNSFLDSMSK